MVGTGVTQSQNPPAHFVIHLGGDSFAVILGHKLNEEPLNLADDADAWVARNAEGRITTEAHPLAMLDSKISSTQSPSGAPPGLLMLRYSQAAGSHSKR
jgi:GGDEF domain-containing protein